MFILSHNFTAKNIKIMMAWHLLGSVPNKQDFFLNLKNICNVISGNLCSTTILHYKALSQCPKFWTKKWQCNKQNPMYGAITTAFSLHKYSGQKKSRSIDLFYRYHADINRNLCLTLTSSKTSP